MTFQPRTDIYATTRPDILFSYIQELEGQLQALLEYQATADEVMHLKLAFQLTNTEARLLALLAPGRAKTKEQLWSALYWKNQQDAPEIKIIDVLICKVRAKVARYGVSITTVWASGYTLDDPTLVRKAMAGEPVERVDGVVPVPLGKPLGGIARAYGSVVEAGIKVLRDRAGPDGHVAIVARELSVAVDHRAAGSDLIRRFEAKGWLEVVERPTRGGVWRLRVLA